MHLQLLSGIILNLPGLRLELDLGLGTTSVLMSVCPMLVATLLGVEGIPHLIKAIGPHSITRETLDSGLEKALSLTDIWTDYTGRKTEVAALLEECELVLLDHNSILYLLLLPLLFLAVLDHRC